MKKHILTEMHLPTSAGSAPNMTGYEFEDEKGYWVNKNSKKPSIEDPQFAAPRTKKADIETGEDKKGE